MPTKSPQERYADERLARLLTFNEKGNPPAQFVQLKRKIKDNKELAPDYSFLGSRTRREGDQFAPQWRSAACRVIKDSEFKEGKLKDFRRVIDPEASKIRAQMTDDYIASYYGWNGTIIPEYDMREPIAIYDTEVFVRRAVTRRLDLAFRNGFQILSEREKDGAYIRKRIATCEYVGGRSWQDLLKGILYNLFTTCNCFVLKIRKAGDKGAGVPQKKGMKPPVAGFTIVPAHQLFPYLVNGRIDHWRWFFETGRPYKEVANDDLIHFELDRKPGHIFATPRTIGVRDDIFALRRLEENIELLFINHLFPLFHVKVGSEKAPCTYGPNGESEIDLIRWQIQNMPKEGVFVTDERVEVQAVGAEGKSLDFTSLIAHYKARIYAGLGVSAIDMGEGETSTRATADNVSQNLKDSIKADLDSFGNQLRLTIFKEWFLEANYSTSVQDAVAATHIKFAEIDLDNLIKYQNHILQLFNNHLITETEARHKLGERPILGTEKKEPNDRSLLHYALHVVDLVWQTEKAKNQESLKMQQELVPMQTKEQTKLLGAQTKLAEVQAKAEQVKAGAKEQVLAAQAKHMPTIAKAKVMASKAVARKSTTGSRGGRPQSGTAKKTTQTASAVQNKVTPTNQHGSNLGPTKAKSGAMLRSEFYDAAYDRLIAARNELIKDGVVDTLAWRAVSSAVIDKAFQEEVGLTGENYYTNQVGEELMRLKLMVAEDSHPEMLAVMLSNGLENLPDATELAESIPGSPAE
jgi:hypothetical protein